MEDQYPRYGEVKYSAVYPGIDLVYYGREGRLEYDFRLQSGADPGPIAMEIEGARRVYVVADGDLVLVTAAGDVRQHRPVAYQEFDGRREPVRVGYRLRAVDATGVYVAGTTTSLDFPATAGAYQTSIATGSGTQDAFVAKLSLDGTQLLYAT